MSVEEIKSILEAYDKIAVVGLSRDPKKDSHRTAEYMQSFGYQIIPVNPFADKILGQKSYKSILDIPTRIHIIDIFRPAEEVNDVVKDAVQLKSRTGFPKVIWMQLGIINQKASEQAKKACLIVIMNKCIMREHNRLYG